VRYAVLGFVGFLAVLSVIGVALSPYLLVNHPVLLVALSPVGRHVALAVPAVDPTLLVAVTVIRRVVGKVASYGLGVLYGNAAVAWMEARSPQLGRLVRWVESLFQRFGAPLLVLAPAHSLALVAGAARTKALPVVIYLTVGESLWVIGTAYFGAVIATWTKRLTDFLSAHMLESTLVCVALVLARAAWGWHKRRRTVTTE
jgi:membrane protein DedA with SNARE-associated domain